MIDDLAIHRGEAGSAVWHDALALGGAHRRAQIRLGRLAEEAVPSFALGGIAGDYEVTDLIVSDTLTDIVDDSSGFMAEDRRELSLGVLARLCVYICVAEGVRDDLHSDFTALGWGHLHIYLLEWLIRREDNSSFARDHSGSRFLAFDHLNIFFCLLLIN